MRSWIGVLTVAIGIGALAVESAAAKQVQNRPPAPKAPAAKPPAPKPPAARPPVAPAPATKPPAVKPPAVKAPAPPTPGPQAPNPADVPGNEENAVKVKLTDCPPAVQKTLNRESAGGTLDEIAKQNDEGQSLYEADVKLDGKNYDVLVAPDGTLLKKELDEDDGKESAVKFDECPPAVQKTLVREAAGAKIEMVAKQSQQGRPIFEATVPIDGKPYDIVVDGDGMLLVKRLDDDEQEMPEAAGEKT